MTYGSTRYLPMARFSSTSFQPPCPGRGASGSTIAAFGFLTSDDGQPRVDLILEASGDPLPAWSGGLDLLPVDDTFTLRAYVKGTADALSVISLDERFGRDHMAGMAMLRLAERPSVAMNVTMNALGPARLFSPSCGRPPHGRIFRPSCPVSALLMGTYTSESTH